jgi:hypothetical protein
MSLDKEIAELLERIDEHPDKLHSDSTPAVDSLIAIGMPVLPRVFPLMLDKARETRLRAFRVIELVTMKIFGFRKGQGWLHADDEQAWRSLWKGMGGLDPDAPDSARAMSVALWKSWLNGQPGIGGKP